MTFFMDTSSLNLKNNVLLHKHTELNTANIYMMLAYSEACQAKKFPICRLSVVLFHPSVTISSCSKLRPKKRSPMVWKRNGISLT